MEETISLKEIAEVLKKRWLMIVSLSLGALIASAIISYFMLTPTYEATTQFIVNSQQGQEQNEYDVNDIRTNVELINTYNVIIKSDRILAPAIEEADLDMTTAQLESQLSVSSQENSQVVNVTVTDESQQVAATIANTVVEVFQQEVPDLMNVDNVSVLSEALVKENPSPVSPNPPLNMAIALIIGLMVGVGIAFLLEYLDQTLKTEEDIEAHLGVSVLGVISTIEESDIQHRVGNVSRNQQRGVAHVEKTKKTI
ncbi:YveK family protein [Pontibacillus litoralis]|uniref:Capsular polysaccharide biosynthesis protein n=1 Tax=Pontibacillus litoralis JSM 072002 TaxID=1385512 RepID=A0A0A5G5K9_9BACI|nr:Wzz/FepE/Etk N-terminal domain-containing protein [Pontibacillus litoralis]KGX86375.1 capsular polysaccharide biosynthesis protein [Pontibacillus litoralis JSM 072002]